MQNKGNSAKPYNTYIQPVCMFELRLSGHYVYLRELVIALLCFNCVTEGKFYGFIILMFNLTGSMITQLQLVVDMPVSYRLISGGPQFSIDLRGKVTLTGPLDREDIAAHSLAVLALTESSPPLTALTEISLQVLDSNDNAPIFDSDTYSVGVPENVLEGTSVFKGE